jgi:DNA/RNA non-specific endonuclease
VASPQRERAQAAPAQANGALKKEASAPQRDGLLGLQRVAGNRATVALMRLAAAETRPAEGPTGDPNESGREQVDGAGETGEAELRQSLVTRSSSHEAIRRKILSYTAPKLETHAGALKALGVNAKDQGLPGNEGLQPIERPSAISAEVDAKSIRKDERQKDSILSKVTSLARGEQFILQGADLKKFFDAGHLIGDQLIGGTTDTFEYWNLAPQVSEFNTPKYSEIEAEIRNYATQNYKIKMDVNLTYPGDYTVTVGQLKKRGAIPANVPRADTNRVAFARRIPSNWQMRAILLNSAEPGAVAESPATPGQSVLGNPFSVALVTYTIAQPDPHKIGFQFNLFTRKLVATQWAPSEGISAADVLSYIKRTYPDIVDEDDVTKLLSGNDKVRVKLFKAAAYEITMALLELTQSVVQLKDAPQAGEVINAVSPRIQAKLKEATADGADLAEAASALVTAKAWVSDLQEEIQALKKKQDETLPLFGYTTAMALQNEIQSGIWSFQESQEQMSFDYQPKSEKESLEIEARSGFGQVRDVRGMFGISHVAETSSSGGTLQWSLFGNECPVKEQEKLMIDLNGQPTTVVVVSADRLFSGPWVIGWRHPGSM